MIEEKVKDYFNRFPDLRILFFFDVSGEYLEEVQNLIIKDIHIAYWENNPFSLKCKLIEELIGLSIPIFIDTKKTDLERFQGAWVKINELEYSKIKSECSGLIVTHGAKGASIKALDIECPALNVEVSDVTGAGDTFLAALTFEYLNTKNIEKAVKFAIRASAITVQHIGVYSPTLEEIQ